MASVYLLLRALYTSSLFASALNLQQSGERTVFRPTFRKRQNTVLSLTASPTTTCGPTLASPDKQERIDWIVRPATIEDANQTAKLLSESFYTILPQNYDQETLSITLPFITTPRQKLLTGGTWYVVEDPVTRDIVGCGGWSLRTIADANQTTTNSNATDVPIPDTNQTATNTNSDATDFPVTDANQTATKFTSNATEVPALDANQTATNTNSDATDFPVTDANQTATKFTSNATDVPVLDANQTATNTNSDATDFPVTDVNQTATKSTSNATDVPVLDANQTATTSNATEIPVPNLRHFATHPNRTRQGIGKALWARTWRDISEAVGPETPLEVYSTLTAEPFYASFGFVPVRRVEVPMGKDCLFPVIFMRREAQHGSLSKSSDGTVF